MKEVNMWINIDPLKVTTPISSGVNLSKNLPMICTYKYKVGDIFLDPTKGNIIEITDLNSTSNCYQGKVEIKYGDKKEKSTTMFSKLIYESSLDRMERYDSVNEMVEQQKKKNGINYKIHYVDIDPNSKVVRQKVQQMDLTMTGVRALAKMLNSIKKRNPNRRVVMVSVVDDAGKFLTTVKFLPQEIKEQKFLTGMKERLLAYAKYELGYEVAIGF